jgi:single-strand DNA-binding protein
MNKAMIVGRLTRDPELKATGSGKAVANFTVAVNRRFKNPQGGYDADFIPVVVWGRQAETASQYLRKGSQVGVVGRIQVRSYQANDGTNRYVTEIVADEVEFLSPKSEGCSTQESSYEIAMDDDFTPFDMDDDDLPF